MVTYSRKQRTRLTRLRGRLRAGFGPRPVLRLATLLRALGFSILALASSGTGLAQQSGGVVLESSESLFAILAARTAAGEEPAPSSSTGEEERRFVREYLGRRQIPVSAELRAFFAENQPRTNASGNLSQCVSLALLMGPPPDYKTTAPQANLPPDARKLAAVTPLLKSFYDQANLTDIWAQMQPLIQREIDRQSPFIRRTIELSDAYVRSLSGAYLGRTYSIVLSPLGAPEQAQARIYGQNYYVVLTPSKEPQVSQIRHQYLHFLLDPVILKYGPEIDKKRDLKSLIRPAPLLGTDFKEDFGLFVAESLISAVELRIDKRPVKEASDALDGLASRGFVLAPYFYAALIEYEKQEVPLATVLKDMIVNINLDQEREKISRLKFSQTVEPVVKVPPPVLSPEESLLNEGENLIAEGKYLEARSVFRNVLDTLNANSERALFGMAVVSSNMRKPGLAEDYFKKTLEVAQDVRIVTWAHIYLGRLYDLETDRRRALEEYRAAALTAASYPEALRAVQDGMERPFGFHK